jgi:hypothetical protein
MSGRLSLVPSSITPQSVAQWRRYRLSIQVRNETPGLLTLNEQSAISLGVETAHPAAATLGQEVHIAAGQTVTLTFARVRICGLLLAGEYAFQVRLQGLDGQGADFEEALTGSDGLVRVTESPAPSNHSIGVGARWTAVIARQATRASLGFIARTGDDYPDDVTIELVPELEARLLSHDAAPFWGRQVLPDLVAPDWREFPLYLQGWEHLAPDQPHNVGVLLAGSEGVHCPHQGLHATLRVGGHLRVILSADANLNLPCATTESHRLAPGGEVRLNVCVQNQKRYAVNTERNLPAVRRTELWQVFQNVNGRKTEGVLARDLERSAPAPFTPRTGLRVVREDGGDASQYFILREILGAAGFGAGESGIVTLRVEIDKTSPRGWYRMYPVIGSYTYAYDEKGAWGVVAGVVDGFQTTPPVWGAIEIG